MSNAVTQRGEIFVRSILAESQPVLADVILDLAAPHPEQRPYDRQVDTINSPCRNFPHRTQAGAAGSTKQIDQKSFDQIVSVVRDEDRPAVSAPCGFSKECVTRFTRRSFNRHLLFLCECADVCRTEFKFNAASRCRASAPLARLCAWQAKRLPCTVLVIAFDKPFNE